MGNCNNSYTYQSNKLISIEEYDNRDNYPQINNDVEIINVNLNEHNVPNNSQFQFHASHLKSIQRKPFIHIVFSFLNLEDIMNWRCCNKTWKQHIYWQLLSSYSFNLNILSDKCWNIRFNLKLCGHLCNEEIICSLKLVASDISKSLSRIVLQASAFINSIHVNQFEQTDGSETNKFTSFQLLMKIKSCVIIKRLSLGSTGYIGKICDDDLEKLIKKFGVNLYTLELFNLSFISPRVFQIIASYCIKLKNLRIFSCCIAMDRSDREINSFLEMLTILKNIELLDVRYSLDFNSYLANKLMCRLSRTTQVFLATTYDLNSLSVEIWEKFLQKYSSSILMYVFATSIFQPRHYDIHVSWDGLKMFPKCK